MKQEFYGRNGFSFQKKPSIGSEFSQPKLPRIDKPLSQKFSTNAHSNSLSVRKQSDYSTPKNFLNSNNSYQQFPNQPYLTSQRKNLNFNENSSIHKLQNFYHVFHSLTPSMNNNINEDKGKSLNNKRITFQQNSQLKPLSFNLNPSEPAESTERTYSYYYKQNPELNKSAISNKKTACFQNLFEKVPTPINKLKKITINELESFLSFKIPQLEPSRNSKTKNYNIKCFAANTHQGLIRNYNEDRVSIVLNLTKPNDKVLKPGEKWPKCSFFAVYDGHGGKKCAEFLRDHLHSFIIKESTFPSNPTLAIQSGCQKAEEVFLHQAEVSNPVEKSGSCANFILIIENMIYSCNIGDSRALISFENGQRIEQLTTDHKPDEINEQKRITAAGGKIYQTQGPKIIGNQFNGAQLVGPYRVFPGRLSVSRTFGDIEAKWKKYGGNSRVIICTPEIQTIQITNSLDYIIIACDGIFDKLSNNQVAAAVNEEKNKNYNDIHELVARSVENIIQTSFKNKTFDNVTVVMIGFKNFKQCSQKKVIKNLLSLTEQKQNLQTSAFFKQIYKLDNRKSPQRKNLSSQDTLKCNFYKKKKIFFFQKQYDY